MSKEMMQNIKGGAFKLSATWLNAASRAVNVLLTAGRYVGSSIRRISSKNYC